jgi:hypothetical protein
VLLLAALAGCAKHPAPGMKRPDSSASNEQSLPPPPILYHRTGGIAATDDRVVIWPDGLVEVSGKILPPGTTRLSSDRLSLLHARFVGWAELKDQYLASDVADAYTITISYGDKTIEASDLAPDLPPQFRQIFTEIEAIAAPAQPPAPAAP